MHISSKLLSSAQKFERWLSDECFPLWVQKGFSPIGGHYEKLKADGDIDSDSAIRVRVQARQAYSFAVAYERGWCPEGKPLCLQLLDFIECATKHPQKEGYTHLLDSQFAISDTKQDLYDHAFMFLAFAWGYRVSGDRRWLKKADALIDYWDSNLAQLNGGWLEGDYAYPARRQNPHMHLFEAFMALYQASGEAKWLSRAGELFTLFQSHFYEAQTGLLLEFFDNDWRPLNEDGERVIEPGHMLEWVWLLRWYEQLTGRDVAAYVEPLYRNGQLLGRASTSPLIVDWVKVDTLGHVCAVSQSKRSWPMTELIKAHIAQARQGDLTAEIATAEAIDLLMSQFLQAKTAGAYIDKRGEEDEIADAQAQASTLYHLVVACSEVADYCAQRHADLLDHVV